MADSYDMNDSVNVDLPDDPAIVNFFFISLFYGTFMNMIRGRIAHWTRALGDYTITIML